MIAKTCLTREAIRCPPRDMRHHETEMLIICDLGQAMDDFFSGSRSFFWIFVGILYSSGRSESSSPSQYSVPPPSGGSRLMVNRIECANSLSST